KYHLTGFLDQRLLFRVHPLKAGFDRSGLLAVGEAAQPIEDDEAAVGCRIARLVVPEVEPVDVAVAEPEPALVLLVAQLAFDGFHRIAARHNRPGSRADRMEIRFRGFRASDVKRGERLSLDIHRDAISIARNLHLP